MSIYSFVTIIFLSLASLPSHARVEVCSRKAQIVHGLVRHYWLKTDRVEAGMGPTDLKPFERIGDTRADGFWTPVSIVDHSTDVPDRCVDIDVNESCVDEALVIGRPLGNFHPFNTCYSFVVSVLSHCQAFGDNYDELIQKRPTEFEKQFRR